jgi:hypothetical protein
MRTGGARALLSLAPGPVFDAGRHRTGAVGARASAGAQLRVEDVEGVGGDLRNVDVVQRTQVAGDNPPVLLQSVGRPAPLLYVKPLRSQVAERASARDRIAVSQLDGPAVALRLGGSLARGLDDTRGVLLLAGQRVPTKVRTQLPHAGLRCRTLPAMAPYGRRWTGIGWDAGWDNQSTSQARGFFRGLWPGLSCGTPNGIRTRAATLRGWCPRPLDDGGKRWTRQDSRTVRVVETWVRGRFPAGCVACRLGWPRLGRISV